MQRLLILSSDVEQNPGPTGNGSDKSTQAILNAIKDSKDALKADVKSVKDDLLVLKNELGALRENLKSVKRNQTRIDVRLKCVEEKIEHLEFDREVVQGDIQSLSMHDDNNVERLSTIERQLNGLELERLKPNLRIFGLEESETSANEWKSVVKREVLGAVGMHDAELIDAWRVGDVNTPYTPVIQSGCIYTEVAKNGGVHIQKICQFLHFASMF